MSDHNVEQSEAALWSDCPPIMEQLRTETHVLHKLAEGQAFQQDLMRGCLPQELFVAYLEQLWLIHTDCETALHRLAATLPVVRQVIQPCQYHAPRLLQDLHYFGSDPTLTQPLAATTAFLARLEAYRTATPYALLGVHYVLEGSKNGGRFQAVRVRQAYHLPEEAGTNYLAPYGSQQAQVWAQYKAAMNRLTLTSTARAALVLGASETFGAFVDLCQELMELEPATMSPGMEERA